MLAVDHDLVWRTIHHGDWHEARLDSRRGRVHQRSVSRLTANSRAATLAVAPLARRAVKYATPCRLTAAGYRWRAPRGPACRTAARNAAASLSKSIAPSLTKGVMLSGPGVQVTTGGGEDVPLFGSTRPARGP
jgi:hypothetical protein